MSNVSVFNPSAGLPAHLRKGELSEVTKALAGNLNSGKSVSIKGGVFRLIVDGKQVAAIDERYLDVVVVNAAPKIGRTWYATKFNEEDTPKAPDCWSADGDLPDPTSAKPQSTQCATCPQNAAGSGEGDSKACRYSQRIAVVLANDQEGDVLRLSVPAKSIFGKEENGNHPLQSYVRLMATQGANVDAVVTRLKFDTNAATPKLFFKPMRWLTEDEYLNGQRQGQTPDAKNAVSYHPSVGAAPAAPEIAGTPPSAAAPQPTSAPAPKATAVDEEPPAPPPKPRGRPPKAAAAPVANPVDDEPPPPEPTVRTKPAPAAAPVAPGSLAAMVSAWDDE